MVHACRSSSQNFLEWLEGKRKTKLEKNQLNLMIYICWSSNHMVRVKFMFLCYDGLDASKGNFYIIIVNFWHLSLKMNKNPTDEGSKNLAKHITKERLPALGKTSRASLSETCIDITLSPRSKYWATTPDRKTPAYSCITQLGLHFELPKKTQFNSLAQWTTTFFTANV